MASTGVIDLVGMAATLAIATPLIVFGVSELAAGEPIGLLFLALAVGLFAVERILVTPGDLPGRLLDRTLGRAAIDPESAEASEEETAGPGDGRD